MTPTKTDDTRRHWLSTLGAVSLPDQPLVEALASSRVGAALRYTAADPKSCLTRFEIGTFSFYESCRDFDPDDVPAGVTPLGGGPMVERAFGVIYHDGRDGGVYWERQDAGEDPPAFDTTSDRVVQIAESFEAFFDGLERVGGDALKPVDGQDAFYDGVQTLPFPDRIWGMRQTLAADGSAITFGEGPTLVFGREDGRWTQLFSEPEFEAGVPREWQRVDYDGNTLAVGQESSTASYGVAFFSRAKDEFEFDRVDGKFSGKIALAKDLCATARKTDRYAIFLGVLKRGEDGWTEIYRADLEDEALAEKPRLKQRKSCSKKDDCTCKKCIDARACSKDDACLCSDCCHRYEFATKPLYPDRVALCVATDGQWIVVGCDDLSALVFRYSKGKVAFHSRIRVDPPVVKQRSFRGEIESAVFDGNRLLLAAPSENSASIKPGSKGTKARSGAVFVFELKKGKWTQVQVVKEPTVRKEASFGTVCSARNGWLAVSTEESTWPSSDPRFFGRVFLYRWTGKRYELRAEIPVDTHRFAGVAVGEDFLTVCLSRKTISFMPLA